MAVSEEKKEKLHAEFYSMNREFYIDESNKTKKLMNFVAELEYCFRFNEAKGEIQKCEKLLALYKNNTYYKDKKLRFYEDDLPKNVEDFVHKLFLQYSEVKLRSKSARAKVNNKIISEFQQ